MTRGDAVRRNLRDYMREVGFRTVDVDAEGCCESDTQRQQGRLLAARSPCIV